MARSPLPLVFTRLSRLIRKKIITIEGLGDEVTPDVCRFAKSNLHVVIASIAAFVLGCFGLQFAGTLVAITTSSGDFTVLWLHWGWYYSHSLPQSSVYGLRRIIIFTVPVWLCKM